LHQGIWHKGHLQQLPCEAVSLSGILLGSVSWAAFLGFNSFHIGTAAILAAEGLCCNAVGAASKSG
jgi:hypothetical protein